MKLTVNVDGGARGNPGPAGIGAVVRDAGGEILLAEGRAIGRATNNEAEYRALIFGIEQALSLGGTELELIGDSELVVRQVRGEYKVKKEDLKPLKAEVLKALQAADSWTISHVKREHNRDADRLVNEALDAA